MYVTLAYLLWTSILTQGVTKPKRAH